MNPILAAGLLIGSGCAAWMFVMGATGWYKDPNRAGLFIIGAIAIEVIGLFWGLRRTAAEGRGVGAQIVAGTLMAVVAGVIVIAGSLAFTTVAFPEYLQETRRVQRELLAEQGRSDAETMADYDAAATPMAQAMSGFIGTLITGILASSVLALVLRRSTPRARVETPHRP
jgi:hypothetical protein